MSKPLVLPPSSRPRRSRRLSVDYQNGGLQLGVWLSAAESRRLQRQLSDGMVRLLLHDIAALTGCAELKTAGVKQSRVRSGSKRKGGAHGFRG